MSNRVLSLALAGALAPLTAGCAGPDADGAADAGAADADVASPQALDRCGDEGVALEVAWDVDNLHGDLVAMAITPDGTVLLASADGAVKQWSLGSSADQAPLPGGRPAYGAPLTEAGAAVGALALSADGGRVLGGDASGALRQWALPDAVELAARPMSTLALTAIAGVPGGGVVIADQTAAMRVVGPDGGDGGDAFQTVLWGVSAMLTAGEQLFTAGHDYGSAAVERRAAAFPHTPADTWDTFGAADRVGGEARALALSADGRLAVGGDGYVVVLAADDLAAGPSARLAVTERARGVTWTASGAHLAIAADGRVALWDAALTAEVAGLTLADPIAVAIDPSGERLVVATADGHLRALVCR